MSNKLSLNHLSDNECERILNVLQRDYELRNRERNRLSNLAKDIWQEQQRRNALTGQRGSINDHYCISCLTKFSILFNRPIKCNECAYQLCKLCCEQISLEKKSGSVCSFCIKQKPGEKGSTAPPKPPRLHGLDKSKPSSLAKSLLHYGSSQTVHHLPLSSKPIVSSSQQKTTVTPSTYLNAPCNTQADYNTPRDRLHSQSDQSALSALQQMRRRHTEQLIPLPVLKYCNLCGESLSPNSKKHAQCFQCDQWICKGCAVWDALNSAVVCSQHTNSDEYNKHSADWLYDPDSQQFTRTASGNVLASLNRRLSDVDADNQSLPAHDVNSTSASHSGREHGQSADNLLSVANFFQKDQSSHSQIHAALEEKIAELDKALSQINSTKDTQCEELGFDDLKDNEVKKFLEDISVVVNKIQECIANSDREDQLEEMLTFHQSAITSILRNLDEALHLAVDKQTSTEGPITKHTNIGKIVREIIEEYLGEKLDRECLCADGSLNFVATAESIVIKILDEEESKRDSNLLSDTTNAAKNISLRGYSSPMVASGYKLPSFDTVSKPELDPDMLSLSSSGYESKTSAAAQVESSEEEKWDTESSIGATSSNWFFRGKRSLSPYNNSLTGNGKLFQGSQESLVMFVPNQEGSAKIGHRSVEEFDDNSSDSTLASSNGEEETNVKESKELDEDMIRTELRRVPSNNQSDRPSGYVSVSRNTSFSSSRGSSHAKSDFTDAGEDSVDLKFTSKPKSVTLTSGEVAKFTCSVTGVQPIDVYWFKEGVDDTDAIETNEKYEVTTKDEKHTLEIFFTSAEDSGQYLCLAKNDVTSSHWLFGLTVDEGSSEQKAPLFLKEIYDTEVTEGDTIKLRCKVRAYPLPRVLWYKDGKRIENNDRYKLEKFGNRDYMLSIDAVNMDDDAEFEVIAKNLAGEAKSTAQLLVESKGFLSSKEVNLMEKENKRNVSDRLNRKKATYAEIHQQSNGVISHDSSSESRSLNARDISSPSSTQKYFDAHDAESKSTTAQKNYSDSNLITSSSNKKSTQKPMTMVGGEKSPRSPQALKTAETSSTETNQPRRSLRMAMGKANTPIEEISTVQVSSKKVNNEKKQADGEKESEELNIQTHPSKKIETSSLNKTAVKIEQRVEREEHPVQLLKITPLKTDKPESPVLPTTDNTNGLLVNKRAAKPMSLPIEVADGDNKAIAITSKSFKQAKPSADHNAIQKKAVHAGVDIEPGFIREKQFHEVGDDIKPRVTPKRQRKASDTTPLVKLNTAKIDELKHERKVTALPNLTKNTSNKIEQTLTQQPELIAISDSTFADDEKLDLKDLEKIQVPATEELKGSSDQTSLPRSRAEWGEFFPSVEDRCRSLDSTSSLTSADAWNQMHTGSPAVSAAVTKVTERDAVTTVRNIKNGEQEQKTPKVEPTTGSDKPRTRKVVKRTVSVKKTTGTPGFGDAPSGDGFEYIKICGKWVRMKGKTKAEATQSMQTQNATVNSNNNNNDQDLSMNASENNERSPPSRSEWDSTNGKMDVSRQITEFKQSQESSGNIIVGRTAGTPFSQPEYPTVHVKSNDESLTDARYEGTAEVRNKKVQSGSLQAKASDWQQTV